MNGLSVLHTETLLGDHGTVSARFPATANQRLHWDEAIGSPGDPTLNVAFRRRLSGIVSDEAIAAALQQLLDRHEILRTRFVEDDRGALIQEVLEGVRIKLDHVDLRRLPETDRATELVRLGKAAARKPFDVTARVAAAPLFRVLLIRVAADEAYLHLVFHHLVIDGWSLDLLVRELGELAAAADAGLPPALPPVEMHFGDFARWQADVVAGDALDGDRRYWNRKLAGLSDFTVPCDREGQGRGAETEIRSILLPAEVSEPFETQARSAGHTMFSLAGAAAASALHRITGQSEVVLGTQVAGRDDRDSETIVGPLLNTVILRSQARDGEAFAAFAERFRDDAREAIAHQMLPFAEIARIARPSGAAPPYRVNLVVQRTYISSASVEDRTYGRFKIESVAAPSVGALWDLSLFMVGRAEGWRLSCEYSPGRYDGATIDRLLDAWRAQIAGAAAHPAIRQRAPGFSWPAEAQPSPRNPRIDELRKRVLCLQPGGSGVPVMALNNASVLYPLAQAIGTSNPFFDLHLCPSDHPIALPERHFTDHARDAVEMIRLARPHGPYVLMGLCVCGALAIEAARILQEEGETVSLVAMVDTYRPGYRERMGAADSFVRRWQVRYLSTRRLLRRWRAGELSMAQVLDNFRVFRLPVVRPIVAALTASRTSGTVDALSDQNRWFAEGVLLRSQARFAMKPYDGCAILFRSDDAPRGRLFPYDFGWAGYTSAPVDVVIVPGTHDTVFRPAGAAIIGRTIAAFANSEARSC